MKLLLFLKSIEINTSEILLIVAFIAPSLLSADGSVDLNDGIAIDEYIDDAIQTDINRSFIQVVSMVKSSNGSKNFILNGRSGDASAGAGNINIGAGTDLRGATIINLSENNGVVVAQ